MTSLVTQSLRLLNLSLLSRLLLIISVKKAQDAVKSSLEYKLDKKVLSYLEKYTGSLSTYNTAEGKNIPIAFYMNTEKCGKVNEFEYNSTAFSFNGHQYGETGTINGKITILKNDNVKKFTDPLLMRRIVMNSARSI